MRRLHFFFLITAFLLCSALLLAACGQTPEKTESAAVTGSASEAQPEDDTMLCWPFSPEIDRTTGAGISSFTKEGAILFRNSDGKVTFESGDLPDLTITDPEEALRFAETYTADTSYLEGSELLFGRSDTFLGITVYTFLQKLDTIVLDRGVLKVITKEDGTLIGVADSLLSDETEDFNYAEDIGHTSYDLDARFPGYEREIYTAELTDSLKRPVSISVPVVKDPATGKQYLADLERRIYCTELPENVSEKIEDMDRFDPVCMQTGKNIESKLITYSYMIRVYDLFAGKGWYGPDGRGTVCQLIFDDSGESDGNASFNGYADGFMNFSFGVNDEAGQSLRIIAHEFMHGVSDTNHIGPYKNETGALDEAISDNMGDAVESALLNIGFPENDWFECMRRIHTNQRPLYVWDEYYLPPADILTSENDEGGVHTNSAIISMLSYRLAEAGMSPSERFDFWMMFDLCLTPATGFQETAARLPFIAETAGMPEYGPVLRQAAEELNLIAMQVPETPPDGQAFLWIRLPDTEIFSSGPVALQYMRAGAEYESMTYPAEGSEMILAVLQEGYYSLSLRIGYNPEFDEGEEEPLYFFWNGSEWIPEDELKEEDFDVSALSVYLAGGEEYDLDTSSLSGVR